MAYLSTDKRNKRHLTAKDLEELRKDYFPLKPIKSLKELPKAIRDKILDFKSGFNEIYPIYLYGGYSKGKHRTNNPDIDIYCLVHENYTQKGIEALQGKYTGLGVDFKVSRVKLEYSFLL